MNFSILSLADLIMLGLATHEPNFTIIREEFKPNKPRPCALCGQIGHEIKECQGVAREKKGEVIQQQLCTSNTVTFIWLICDTFFFIGFLPLA